MSTTVDDLDGFADGRLGLQQPPSGLARWFDNWLLAVANVDARLARTVPEDWLTLRGLGYQFLGIWMLLVVVQGIAFLTVSGQEWIGFGLALLSATIIVLADRQFIANDYMAEGEYWFRYDQDPNDPRLSELRWKRWLGTAVRYGFGIVISIAVVTIATPGLFLYEITAEVHRLRNERNPVAEAEIVDYRKGQQRIWDSKRGEVVMLDGQIQKTQEALTALQATPSTTSNVDSQVGTMSAEEQRLRLQANLAERCAMAEERGLEVADCASQIPASNLAGCFERCAYWKNLASSYVASADVLKADRERLVSETAERGSQLATRIDSLATDLEQLRETRIAAARDEAAARKAWEQSDATYGTTRRRDADYIDTPVGGIKIVYDAMEHVLSDASATTLRMLFYLKVFLIFLESIVFTSRLFGTARSYTKANYIRYHMRWSGRG